MQNNTSSRPSSASGFRPSTASQLAMPNVKLQAAIEKHGSFANAMESVSSAEFANKLVQVWAGFNDRCRYLDSRISPTGNLSWTEVKSVFSYLHIQKMVTERCLRNLFSDLGMHPTYITNHFDTAHIDPGFSFKDADNVVQINYAAFVEEIRRSIGERPTTPMPYGIKSGWSAERPRGKCQVHVCIAISLPTHAFFLQNIKELEHVKWMTAHRQAYDVAKGGPALQYIVEGAYFNDHDEPKERTFNFMRDMVEGVGYLDFTEPFKKSPWHGKEHILRNLQHTARLSKRSALRRSQTPEPGAYNKILSPQQTSPFTRSPSRLGNEIVLHSNQNFGAGVLSRTHANPVVSPSPGLPTLAVKRFGLQPDTNK